MKEAIEIAERLAREEKIKTRKKHKLEVIESPTQIKEEKNVLPCVVGSELKIARVESEQPKHLNVVEQEPKENTTEENGGAKEHAEPKVEETKVLMKPIERHVKKHTVVETVEVAREHLIETKVFSI